jgi:hypothetical protein
MLGWERLKALSRGRESPHLERSKGCPAGSRRYSRERERQDRRRQTIGEIELETCRLRSLDETEFPDLVAASIFPLELDKFKLIIASLS